MALRGEKTMLMEVKELHRSEKSIVTLVIDPDTGIRYVRKELKSSAPGLSAIAIATAPLSAKDCAA